MKWLLIVPLLLALSFLSGCATLHDELVDNPNLTTDQRVERLAKQPNSDAFDIDNKTCTSLLECAVYLKDYELAEWILENAKHPQYYTAGDWNYKKHVIYAPLRANLSDAEASKYLALFLSHGFNPSVCDYGKVRPITYAFKKGYIESFKVLLIRSDELLNGESKQQITHCADVGPYTSYLFTLELSKSSLRELSNDAFWNASTDSLLSAIIRAYDSSEAHQAEMLFLLLEAMDSPQKIYNYRTGYRCAKYSRDSALAYANCKSQNDVVNLLTAYYMSTSKLSESERKRVFSYADSLIKETLSESELIAKNAKIKRENAEYRRKLKAQFDKAFNDGSSGYDVSGFQSVSEQLGTSRFSDATVNSVNTPKNSNLVDFDFHLYVDSVGVEQKPEQEKTYFMGETCKRYPQASTCKQELVQPRHEEGYWDCGVFVKGKMPPPTPSKPGVSRVCAE